MRLEKLCWYNDKTNFRQFNTFPLSYFSNEVEEHLQQYTTHDEDYNSMIDVLCNTCGTEEVE